MGTDVCLFWKHINPCLGRQLLSSEGLAHDRAEHGLDHVGEGIDLNEADADEVTATLFGCDRDYRSSSSMGSRIDR